MLVVPEIQREAVKAANVGVSMSSSATPLGFTFCKYSDGSLERWNFLCGCISAYFGEQE